MLHAICDGDATTTGSVEGLSMDQGMESQDEGNSTSIRSRRWRSVATEGRTTLKAELSGNFPGSPMTTNFHFVLVNDQIA